MTDNNKEVVQSLLTFFAFLAMCASFAYCQHGSTEARIACEKLHLPAECR